MCFQKCRSHWRSDGIKSVFFRQEEERRRREEEMMIRQREMEEQMRRQREESYSRMGYMDPVSQGWKYPSSLVAQVPTSHVDP